MKSPLSSLKIFTVGLLALAAGVAAVAAQAVRSVAVDVGYKLYDSLTGHMQRNGLMLMGYGFPEGSKFYYSNTLASAKSLSAVTNANPAVATSTTHGYSDNDEVLVISGWEDLTSSVLRVDQLTTDTFSLLGLDSSDTAFYAPGGAANSTAQKLSGWTEIPQVLGISAQGGDPRFTTVSPLAKRNSFNIPTGFNPVTTTLQLGHDPSNATYQAMLAISRRLTQVAFKMVLGGGGTTYGYGYMATSEFPRLNQNQVNAVDCVLSFQGRTLSYAT